MEAPRSQFDDRPFSFSGNRGTVFDYSEPQAGNSAAWSGFPSWMGPWRRTHFWGHRSRRPRSSSAGSGSTAVPGHRTRRGQFQLCTFCDGVGRPATMDAGLGGWALGAIGSGNTPFALVPRGISECCARKFLQSKRLGGWGSCDRGRERFRLRYQTVSPEDAGPCCASIVAWAAPRKRPVDSGRSFSPACAVRFLP